MMTFNVSAKRVDENGSLATAENAQTFMDTGMVKSGEAFNPVELLLAALSACMIKGIERVVPALTFQLDGVEIELKAQRPEAEARIESIEYSIVVETNEEDRRLDLLHENVRKFGTIFNTVAQGTNLTGTLTRKIVQ
jgi:uncharacterized OsmC-like protein